MRFHHQEKRKEIAQGWRGVALLRPFLPSLAAPAELVKLPQPDEDFDWRSLWTPGSAAFWLDPDLFWPVEDPHKQMCWMMLDRRPAPKDDGLVVVGVNGRTIVTRRSLYNPDLDLYETGVPPPDAYYRMPSFEAKAAALSLLAQANDSENEGDAANAYKLRQMATLILSETKNEEARNQGRTRLVS